MKGTMEKGTREKRTKERESRERTRERHAHVVASGIWGIAECEIPGRRGGEQQK
jgi:hypothetical protein